MRGYLDCPVRRFEQRMGVTDGSGFTYWRHLSGAMTAECVRARVHIIGRVQGVGYRRNTEEQATKLGINGWVRNLDDGRVKAVFEGDRETVEEMIEWCHTGSPRANVDDVQVKYEDPRRADGFRVRW